MNLTTLYVIAAAPFTPAPGPGWGSGQQATTVAQTPGLNWVFLGSIVVGIVTALFAFIGLSQIASSRKGDVQRAGKQSAVATIGTFWVALAIGGFSTLLVSGFGGFLRNVFTG